MARINMQKLYSNDGPNQDHLSQTMQTAWVAQPPPIYRMLSDIKPIIFASTRSDDHHHNDYNDNDIDSWLIELTISALANWKKKIK